MPVYFGERLEAPPRKFFTATAGVSLVLFLFGASASLLGSCVTLAGQLPLLLLGLATVGSGLFFSQAVATGFIGNSALRAKGAASGLYLGAYYAGGLCGAWAMGVVFDVWVWMGCAIAGACASGLMIVVVELTWASHSRVPSIIPTPEAVG